MVTTREELQAKLEDFKTAVSDFAKSSVVEEYDPRLHDGLDISGNTHTDINPRKTLVHGEESKVGHIFAAIENQIVPLLGELEGEPVAASSSSGSSS